MRRNLSYYCLLAHGVILGVLFFTHILFVVNHTINATPQVATVDGEGRQGPTVIPAGWCHPPHLKRIIGMATTTFL